MSVRPAWSEAFVRPEELHPTGLDGVRITRSWAFGDGRAQGVRVAIVDSGVDPDHPLVGGLAGSVAVEPLPDREPDTQVREVQGPADLYGHGTACAGIIRGLAPGAELYSVRVLGENLTARGTVFAAGLEWCIEQRMQVVNLSLSTSAEWLYETFHELVDRASHRGVVLVSAMNNLRKASYPSEFAGVLSVAASPGDDPEVFWRNPAPPAEWAAPGFLRTVAWTNGGTATVTGNSFAAPVIAAHAARILGAHPGLAPWQVKTVLAALVGTSASKRRRQREES
jgi:subtilisin family serine protease